MKATEMRSLVKKRRKLIQWLILSLSWVFFSLVNVSSILAENSPISVSVMPIGTVVLFGGLRWVKINMNNDFMAVDAYIPITAPTYFDEMTTDYCQSMAIYQTLSLIDRRDNKGYRIRKFPDGNCWMIDNLAYGSCTDSSFDESTTVGYCYAHPNSITCGYLYNWTMANSVCPPNWLLPTGSDSGQFQALANAMGTTYTYWLGATYWAGVLSGQRTSAGLYGYGLYGIYWSSTQHDASLGYRLYFSTGGIVDPRSYDDKFRAFAVRCLFFGS